MEFVVVLLVLAAAPDPTPPGPFNVGVVTVDFVDAGRKDRRLRTEIWYPTNENGIPGPRYSSGIPTRAIREAAAAPGEFPCVLFSHGNAAVREQSTFFTEHLASHGYIVASPDHQHNTGRDLNLLGLVQSALDRPVDLKFILDRLVEMNADPANRLYGRLDLERIAAAGHSFGGYTALAVGGVWLRLYNLPGFALSTAKSEYQDFRDPRIKAVIAMAPPFTPGFDEFAASQCTLPTLVFAASDDKVLPFEKEQAKLNRCLGGDHYLAYLVGGSHFNFNNDEMLESVSILIRRLHRPTIERDRADALINGLALAFLDRHLVGTDRYGSYLTSHHPSLTLTFTQAAKSNSCVPIIKRRCRPKR